MTKKTKPASVEPVTFTDVDLALLDVIAEIITLDDAQIDEAAQRYAEAKG